MKNKYDILIIGGVAAGTSAAASALRENPSLNVAIFQKEPYISYGGCGLPYVLNGKVKEVDDLFAFTSEKFQEKKGAEVYTNYEAIDVDFEQKYVLVKGNMDRRKIFYDKLIISTGASPIIPKFDVWGQEGIFKMRNPSDDEEILNFIEKNKPSHATIIGGGFIGVEVAEVLIESGIKVTLIEAKENILGDIEPEIHDEFSEYMIKNGVDLKTESMVENILKKERFIVKTEKESIETDMIIISIGVKPNTDFLLNKNVNMLKNKAIIVDNYMRTNIEDVYAAGDCATAYNILSGEDEYIPLGTTSNKQGKIAGKNAVKGNVEEFKGVIGSLITKFLDMEYAKTGLTYEKAKELDYNVGSVYIKAKARAGYYENAGNISFKMIFDRSTGKILGGHFAGKEIHSRVNIIVSLIYSCGTVQELYNMDLPYSPPFSPVWDITLIAASKAMKKVK